MELLSCVRIALLATLTTSACVPDFVDDTTQVQKPRILAIRAEPAEAGERERVTLRALIARADEQAAPNLTWSLCVERKPLSELGPVSPRCLAGPELDPSVAQALGAGDPATASVQASLPDIACQLFGPQRPDPKVGEPSGRPVDPDASGGFYQPTLAWLGSTAVLGGVRLTCPLSGATREGLVEFNQRYRRNQNPEVTSFELVRDDGSVLTFADGEPAPLRPSEHVSLRIAWPDCGSAPVCGDGICDLDESQSACSQDCTAPRGCGGAERYVVYDHHAQTVLVREESIVVAWYATAGHFEQPRTDQSSASGASRASTQNGFTAPSEGRVELWAVLRDDRGGLTWAGAVVNVTP